MPLTKESLRNTAAAALVIPGVAVAAWFAYGPPVDEVIVVPPVLTVPAKETPVAETPPEAKPVEAASDVPVAESTPTEGIIDRLGSGEVDFFGVMTTHGSDEELDAFETTVGQAPDVLQISIGWELDRYDPSLIERLTDRGALPSIAWEPWDYRPDIWIQPKYSLPNILDGDFDDYIDEWARGLASSEQPVLLRLAHEANGDWYPWSEQRNGNSPGEYVEVWRYVHQRFDDAGADNVIWVWAPNVNPFGSWPMAGVYPGDDYVDLVGLVGYWGHFGETPESVGSFDSVFGSSIEEIRTLTQKPIYISETAASNEGGFKAAWVDEFLTTIAERRDVVGFVWFEAVKEDDWRVDSSPDALESFLDGLDQPAFRR